MLRFVVRRLLQAVPRMVVLGNLPPVSSSPSLILLSGLTAVHRRVGGWKTSTGAGNAEHRELRDRDSRNTTNAQARRPRSAHTRPSTRRALIGRLVFLLLAASVAACSPAMRGPAARAEPENAATPVHSAVLRHGEVIRRSIGGAERHVAEVEVPADSYVQLAVDQLGIDLSARLYAPDGEEVKRRHDSMEWRDAPELFVLDGLPGGRYRIELGIYEWEDSTRSGAYELRIEEQLTLAARSAQLRAEQVRQDALADSVGGWLSSGAIPLRTVEPGSGSTDLERLREVLKGVRVLGLGEATHGTREFFRLKHRLLEFLVTEMGFTHFAMEIPYGESLRINEYVLHGRGDAAGALAGTGFTVWMTEEVLELIEWLRTHNAPLPLERRVHFVGVDMQSQMAAAEHLLGYLGRVAPEYLAEVAEVVAPIQGTSTEVLGRLRGRSAAEKAESQRRLHALVDAIDARQAAMIRLSSEQEFRDALQSARVLQQFERYASLTFRDQHERGFEVRDRAMADNTAQLLHDGGPETRVVLWAHDSHLDRQATLWGSARAGHFLKLALGEAYYGLGITFDHGSFRAHGMNPDGTRGWREFSVTPAPKAWLEWYLARAPHAIYFLDIRSAPTGGTIRRWLDTELRYRKVGATFDPRQEFELISAGALASRFDGILFVRETTAARSLQLRPNTQMERRKP